MNELMIDGGVYGFSVLEEYGGKRLMILGRAGEYESVSIERVPEMNPGRKIISRAK